MKMWILCDPLYTMFNDWREQVLLNFHKIYSANPSPRKSCTNIVPLSRVRDIDGLFIHIKITIEFLWPTRRHDENV